MHIFSTNKLTIKCNNTCHSAPTSLECAISTNFVNPDLHKVCLTFAENWGTCCKTLTALHIAMHNIDTNVRGKMNDKQETPFMPLDQGLTGRVFQLRVGLDLGIGKK